ncbi:MAG TPA: bifunctional UDP-N-acetylglucosamine diphosphorylase/glucosamine-1-phosphate N-acetyltransferase GlmU [Gammaproteobacteria bacterium]|nr:bifunctional UDP-N-acetylglucosamine diphosphorylase/glucosamine-1-phosphate N-acetyltransferase GlmU [Gammaproteobacteria bacterium]
MSLAIIILAAGQGKRMRSDLPKVLHTIGGKPMLAHVLETAGALSPEFISVVYGHGGDGVKAEFERADVRWCLQAEQLGTGHAVMQALPGIDPSARVLILYGDVPLIRPETLCGLLTALEGHALSLLSVVLAEPSGYGRIIRDSKGRIERIIEEKDANRAQREITEVNTGILATGAAGLKRWLERIHNDNAQQEYYLTDCIGLAVAEGEIVHAEVCPDPDEVLGINDKLQLAQVERAYQRRQAWELMREGVTVLDPTRLDVRGRVTTGRDVILDVNVVLEGDIDLADGVSIGPNCVIRNTIIGARTEVLSNCVIEDAYIGVDCRVGPFTRIRPRTTLGEAVHLGNFVEVKASRIDDGSKVNHLSYIGDTEMGSRTNIGAGTIVCNYDGVNKHRTHIGDDVFIGSDTQLIAPVSVGDGATIGAGSTVTKDAPPGQLTLSRSAQKTIPDWQRPVKKRGA